MVGPGRRALAKTQSAVLRVGRRRHRRSQPSARARLVLPSSTALRRRAGVTVPATVPVRSGPGTSRQPTPGSTAVAFSAMADQSTQSITIAAPAADVMAVIADFAQYPVWATSVKKAEVLETLPRRPGQAGRVRDRRRHGQGRIRARIRLDGRRAGRLDAGRGPDAALAAGSYVLARVGGSTEVTYSLTVEIAIPMLGLLKRKLEKMVMDTALKELKKRVESAAAPDAHPAVHRQGRRRQDHDGRGDRAAAGRSAAARPCCVSTDAAHSLGDAFGAAGSDGAAERGRARAVGGAAGSPASARGGLARPPALPAAAARPGRHRPDRRRGADRAARHRRGAGPAGGARPGRSRGDWDVVVVDCAPTAETLRLLALPEALGWYLDQDLPGPAPAGPRAAAVRGAARPGRRAAARRRVRRPAGSCATNWPRSASCWPIQQVTSVRLVLTPEAVVVGRGPADVHRAVPVRLPGRSGRSPTGSSRPAADAARRLAATAGSHAQRGQLAAIADSFAGVEMRDGRRTRAAEPVGADALRAVADAALRAAARPRPGAARSRAVDSCGSSATATSTCWCWRCRWPSAAEVDAVRAGDDLVVTVAGRRRVLSLPSVLRRCDVVGGRLRRRRAAGARFGPTRGCGRPDRAGMTARRRAEPDRHEHDRSTSAPGARSAGSPRAARSSIPSHREASIAAGPRSSRPSASCSSAQPRPTASAPPSRPTPPSRRRLAARCSASTSTDRRRPRWRSRSGSTSAAPRSRPASSTTPAGSSTPSAGRRRAPTSPRPSR